MPRTDVQPPPPYNPAMLRWAREWRARSIEEAAARVGKRPADILAWENGDGVPTVKQARDLAAFYGRSFLEFFRPELPPVQRPALVPDYRFHSGREAAHFETELRDVQAWAESQRLNTLDLFSEIGDPVPQLADGLAASIEDDVESAAQRAREATGYSYADQSALTSKDRDQLPSILRHKFEQAGVLTLRYNGLRKFGTRGICIAATPLPVIVFTDESPNAQAFTLAHELAHVMLRQSAVLPRFPSARGHRRVARVEKWCDRFSAAYLIPKVRLEMLRERPPRPVATISDAALKELAAVFRVSQHAMLIRLVNLGYVNSRSYWEIKMPQFLNEEVSYKSFARPQYYGSRYRSRLGDLYTGLVLEAWNTGRITNHSASELMGIKDLKHLVDIRDRFAA